MGCILIIIGFSKDPNKIMKSLISFTIFTCCFLLSYSQSVDINIFHSDFDTTPAILPSDYFDYCQCTGITTLANIYSFEEKYKFPFSNKIPAKYYLCSIIELDSACLFEDDDRLYTVQATILTQNMFFSPYSINYWSPSDDAMEEEYISNSTSIFDSIIFHLKMENRIFPRTQIVSLVLSRKELQTLKSKIYDSKTNQFLLRIDKVDGDNVCSYQIYANEEFDLSLLYTPFQYYKYQIKRYLSYMNNRKKQDKTTQE